MQSVFKAGLRQRRARVLGVSLLPLSLGHVWALLAFENGFAVSGKRADLSDLVMGAAICSREFDSILDLLNNPDRHIKEIAEWGRKTSKQNLVRQKRAFIRYLNDNCKTPERWKKSGEAQSQSRVPWPIKVAVGIMPLVGESRAWNMSITMAMSYWFGLQENAGDNSIVSDEEMVFVEKVRHGR